MSQSEIPIPIQSPSQGPAQSVRAKYAPRGAYLLDSVSDRDRLYLMFDVLHKGFVDNIERALALGGLSDDPAVASWRMLDVCCGEGLHVAELAQRFPKAHFTAFDREEEAMRTAAAAFGALGNLRFIRHDAQEPLPSSIVPPFDLVQVRFGLTHFRDPSRVLGELRNAMRPGGIIYFVDPRGDVFQFSHPSMELFADRVNRSWGVFGTSAAGDRQVPLLAANGFTVLESKMEEHPASGPDTDDYPGFLLLIETIRSMRKALVDVTRVMTGDEFDEHLRKLMAECRPEDKGSFRLQVTVARKD